MINRFRPRTIRNKLFLIVMLICGITLLLATIAFSVSDRLAARKTLTYIVSSQATIVGQNAAPALTFLDQTAAREVLSGLALQKHIEVARLYDVENHLFAEYTLSAGEQSEDSQIGSNVTLNFVGNLLELYQPVYLEDEQIGTLYVRANLDTLGNRIGSYSSIAFLVLAGLLALTWMLTSRMHRTISKPVNHLVDVARQVTRNNDYSVRAEKMSDDELGELVEGINLMLEQIQSRDTQLADYAAELEQRVAARTADLEALTEQFRHLAYHDELTGLPNRALFVDRLKKSIASCERKKSKLAVMFLDLDKFKVINDTLGHAVGDHLLTEVAQRIRHCLRGEDTVARMGGDEFTILVNDLTDIDAAGDVAGKIVAALQQPMVVNNHCLQISASVGISIFPDDTDQADKLMTFADGAMYQAKLVGRNCYHFYMATLQQKVARKLAMEQSIGKGLANGEFKLYFDPRIDPTTQALKGMVVQLHWLSEEFGHLTPAEFIPMAESSKKISELGAWQLAQCCRQLASWRRQGLVSVPLSLRFTKAQFSDRQLLDKLACAIADHQLSPGDLILELETDTVLSDQAHAKDILARLDQAGITIALDYLGDGRLTLNEMITLPIKSVVLDNAQGRSLTSDSRKTALTDALIYLCHKLNINVVAKGVSSTYLLAKLRKMGCDQVQGSIVSRPLTSEDFASAYLTRR